MSADNAQVQEPELESNDNIDENETDVTGIGEMQEKFIDFPIPDDSPLRPVAGALKDKDKDGNEYEYVHVPYSFVQVKTDEDALAFFRAKQAAANTDKQKERWSLVGIANKLSERGAYQRTYSNLVKQHEPIELRENPEEALSDSLRNMLQAGISREMAEGIINAAREALGKK